MTRRGIILISTLFGLFALSFGVLGVRALTLGPDRAQPTASELAARTTAANDLERQIAVARADVPPALPEVPERIPMPAAQSGGSASSAGQAQGATRAPATREYEDDDDHEHEHDDEHEGEYEDDDEHGDEHGEDDDDHEEGDHDDD